MVASTLSYARFSKLVVFLSSLHLLIPLNIMEFLNTNIATFLMNRAPTFTLEKKSPIEILFLVVFFPWLTSYPTNKLQTRSKPFVFLGYSLTQSAYLYFNPTDTMLFTSRHVECVKDVFPYSILFQI
ncbi:hypothetical protein CR513_36402, partial [Mucuna pruriens]